MAFGFSKTRYSPIAVDFGADSLKLLQLVPGQPPQLVAAAAEVVPAEARTDAATRDAFLVDALRRLLAAQPFKGRRTICSLPAFQTLVQHFEVPLSEGVTLDNHVQQQLRQRFDVDPSRMVVRHFPLSGGRARGDQMEVLCLAATREVVMRYVNIIARAKLDLVGMHSEPLSLCKAFEHVGVGVADPAKAVCYIDIGAASTKVVITQAGRICFAKTIQAGGDQITRQLMATRRISFDDARRERMAQAGGGDRAQPVEAELAAVGAPVQQAGATATGTGLPALDAQASPVASDSAAAAPALGADTMECLVDELQLSLRYHQRLCPDVPVEKLVFLGGESRDVTTCQAIARAVRVAAQLGDPLAHAARIGQRRPAHGVDLDQPQPGWAVPFGLCLSDANL